jgi:hypothetical protein
MQNAKAFKIDQDMNATCQSQSLEMILALACMVPSLCFNGNVLKC